MLKKILVFLGLVKKYKWPEFSSADILRRSTLLVIDDNDFPYLELFRRDGYNIDKWNDVIDLRRLEGGDFDVLLLDIQGVGKKESKEEGFGILKHLRTVHPTQIVIAYSNADWSLEHQPFFDMADAKLPKSADYVDFKRVVDAQMKRKFSIDFYIEHALMHVQGREVDKQKLRKLVTDAILSGNTKAVETYLTGSVEMAKVLPKVLYVVGVAAKIASIA